MDGTHTVIQSLQSPGVSFSGTVSLFDPWESKTVDHLDAGVRPSSDIIITIIMFQRSHLMRVKLIVCPFQIYTVWLM